MTNLNHKNPSCFDISFQMFVEDPRGFRDKTKPVALKIQCTGFVHFFRPKIQGLSGTLL